MSKLKKCLYLIDLLSRRGPMSLKEINEHYQYSSLYDGEIIPRTFARYKDTLQKHFLAILIIIKVRTSIS